jgi:DNA-directed RNA polymerase sigma subunit (sigma70/sigma32)
MSHCAEIRAKSHEPAAAKAAAMAARNHQIILMRERGSTLRSIGKQVGLSCERVRQIIVRHDRRQARPPKQQAATTEATP